MLTLTNSPSDVEVAKSIGSDLGQRLIGAADGCQRATGVAGLVHAIIEDMRANADDYINAIGELGDRPTLGNLNVGSID